MRKQCKDDWHITIFDNSDRKPFWKPMQGVSVIDNTRGQEIDFDAFLSEFPERGESEDSNWGSAKHCKSVDYCFDLFPDGFILMDSDVVLKRDIADLWDESVAWSGWVHSNTARFGIHIERLCPFLCWLNVPMLRNHGIRYFNPEKMWRLMNAIPNRNYDTGAWLLEETLRQGLPHKNIETLDKYIEHFRGGSWCKSESAAHEWLSKMRKYYKDSNMAKKTTPAKTTARKKKTPVVKPAQEVVVPVEPVKDEGIDIVVPMVFPSSGTWLKEYKEACAKYGRAPKIDERVRSWDLERYFFRGISKNMPWIRKIHLILSGEDQIPYWLKSDKIHIVLHKDIIPEEMLPTFNSSTIEMWLHNIEGLSERFIYCNDDMIAVSALQEEDFFIDGMPVMRYEEKPMLAGDFMAMCRHDAEIIAKDYGKFVPEGIVLREGHSYAPMLFSCVKDVVAKHGDLMRDSCTVFRQTKNLNQYLYSLEQWYAGKCVNGQHSHKYFSIDSDYDKMATLLRGGTIGVACFNDSGIGSWAEMRAVLYKVMQELLGEKCDYEI